MEDISLKIFNRLKEKVYVKKKDLKICSSEIKVEYRPQTQTLMAKSRKNTRFMNEKDQKKDKEMDKYKEKEKDKDRSIRKARTKTDLFESENPIKIKPNTCFKNDKIFEVSFKP